MIKKEKTNYKFGFHVYTTQEENLMIKELMNKHSVNVSGLFKNFLRDYYNKMEENYPFTHLEKH